MKTIAQTYIDQGYELGLEQARQEMQQEVQRAHEEAQKVRQELQAKERMGLLSSIELGLELKFGKEGLGLFNEYGKFRK